MYYTTTSTVCMYITTSNMDRWIPANMGSLSLRILSNWISGSSQLTPCYQWELFSVHVDTPCYSLHNTNGVLLRRAYSQQYTNIMEYIMSSGDQQLVRWDGVRYRYHQILWSTCLSMSEHVEHLRAITCNALHHQQEDYLTTWDYISVQITP